MVTKYASLCAGLLLFASAAVGQKGQIRAVENSLPLVRCANNGLTCWVDSRGRIQQKFESGKEGIYGPGFMIAHIPLLQPGEKRIPTFYHQHGDVFGWACVGISVLVLARSLLSKRKFQPAPAELAMKD